MPSVLLSHTAIAQPLPSLFDGSMEPTLWCQRDVDKIELDPAGTMPNKSRNLFFQSRADKKLLVAVAVDSHRLTKAPAFKIRGSVTSVLRKLSLKFCKWADLTFGYSQKLTLHRSKILGLQFMNMDSLRKVVGVSKMEYQNQVTESHC